MSSQRTETTTKLLIRRMRWPGVILAAAACCMVLVWYAWFSHPLPSDDEISRVVATGNYGPAGQLVTFDVPLDHWPYIRAALGHPIRDRDPAKWVSAGELEVTTHTGRVLLVHLYDTGKPGAFSAGPAINRRVYYRGGDSTELKRVMAEAYQAARNRG